MTNLEKLKVVRSILEAGAKNPVPDHITRKALDLISDVIIDLDEPFVEDGAWELDNDYPTGYYS